MELNDINEGPPLKQSAAQNSQLSKGVELLVEDVPPPDDVHVDVEHVEVHEASHRPGETVGKAGKGQSLGMKTNLKECIKRQMLLS
jgi:hypothetical protein